MNIHKLQNEEIDAIRNMVLQHQITLDFLTAEQGGLCVMLNTTCFTYIPNNISTTCNRTSNGKRRQAFKRQGSLCLVAKPVALVAPDP